MEPDFRSSWQYQRRGLQQRTPGTSICISALPEFAWSEVALKLHRDVFQIIHRKEMSRRCCDLAILFSSFCSLLRSGRPFPSPHLRALGSATQGQARDRDSRAALDNLLNRRDKKQLQQTYSGRSAGAATRPESQAAPPHELNLPRRLSPPSHDSADTEAITTSTLGGLRAAGPDSRKVATRPRRNRGIVYC